MYQIYAAIAVIWLYGDLKKVLLLTPAGAKIQIICLDIVASRAFFEPGLHTRIVDRSLGNEFFIMCLLKQVLREYSSWLRMLDSKGVQ